MTTCYDCRLFAPDPYDPAIGACLVSYVFDSGSALDGYECVGVWRETCAFFERIEPCETDATKPSTSCDRSACAARTCPSASREPRTP